MSENESVNEVVNEVKEKKEVNRPAYKAMYEDLQKEIERLKSSSKTSNNEGESKFRQNYFKSKDSQSVLLEQYYIDEAKSMTDYHIHLIALSEAYMQNAKTLKQSSTPANRAKAAMKLEEIEKELAFITRDFEQLHGIGLISNIFMSINKVKENI
jgi:hypothetical protein